MDAALRAELKKRGIECFVDDGGWVTDSAVLEPPCSLKRVGTEHVFQLGSFSYVVSGFCSEVAIGRYCSIGEDVQIGRGAHPVAWLSTSPAFYCYDRPLFDVGGEFANGDAYLGYRPGPPGPIPVRNSQTVNDFLQRTLIGSDVYIGHGAFIFPGVRIGDGAVIGACAVVTRDVPPYAIVGGNPARLLRMRFEPDHISELQRLAWWRFAPWQLEGVPFANIDDAIARLRDLIPGLAPYHPGTVAFATV
jgi:acetyltransferase-like isoleucine patch superfamily enzyme